MYFKIKPRKLAGWTLLEMMIGVTVFSIAGAAISTAYVFSLRSFQALSNYSILDQQNREAIDRITREVRQARTVSAMDTYLTRTLSLIDGDGNTVTYKFDRYQQNLTRTKTKPTGGTLEKTVLLDNCSLINFNLGMRPPIGGASITNYYPTTDLNKAKIVDLTWKTSRALPHGLANSENIQTARIVIRKQKI